MGIVFVILLAILLFYISAYYNINISVRNCFCFQNVSLFSNLAKEYVYFILCVVYLFGVLSL